MAARKTTAKHAADATDDEPLPTSGIEEGDGIGDDIDAVVEELTGEAEYIVLWRTDGPGKQEHVDRVPLSRFSAEYVREKHGGGDYLFRAYGAKEKGGGRKFKKYKEFSIDRSVPAKSGSAAVAWRERGGSVAATSSGHERSDGPPSWLRDLLVATVPIVAGGVVAYMGKEKAADPLLIELIKQRGGDGVNPIELQRLLADERERAIALGERIGGKSRRGDGDGKEDATSGLIREGLATLGTLAEGWRDKVRIEAAAAGGGAGSNAPANPARAIPLTRTGSAGHQPSAPVEGGSVNVPRIWVDAARPYASMLAVMAGKVAPATAAQGISDGMSDEQFSDLLDDMSDETAPGFMGRLADHFPELAAVPVEWITEVLNNISSMVVEDGDSQGATDGHDDHGNNGTGNATKSTDAE